MDRREFCQLLAGTTLSANLPALQSQPAADTEQREALAQLIRSFGPSTNGTYTGRINAVDHSWADWQKRTGELPPKFSALPSTPFPINPIEGITTQAQWQQRKQEIRTQLEHWFCGKMPPKPDNLRAVVTSEREENGITVRDVRLEFGPDHRGTLRVQLLIPPRQDFPGPRPVFLTNHNRWRPWAATAVARGYIGAIYFAADPEYGYDDDSDKFIELYPDYDFSCLARWAWAASRAVDYLHTLPEVDKRCIAISGHSRNGKQAVLAAAFDERITACIPSSGNTGEAISWRLTGDDFSGETLQAITGNFPLWFHPRFRFFAGREDKLPFDQTSILALIAPRPLLITCAYTEEQGSGFAFEQTYRALQPVYDFLGAPSHLGLRLRQGYHATTAGDLEAYVDFLDAAFGRTPPPPAKPDFVFGYTFEGWQQTTGEHAKTAPTGDKLTWALGPEPPQVAFPGGYGDHILTAPSWIEFILDPLKPRKPKPIAVPFGVDLRADLYLPENHAGKLPLVIWLHPFAYAPGYSISSRGPVEELTKRGYAVLAF